MARLVGYRRVSTGEQLEGLGLDVQEQSIRAWARREGHRIVAWATDEALSGARDLDARDGLADALAAVVTGRAAGIVVARLDRLARDLIVQEQILAEVWRHGGEVYSVLGSEQDLRNDPDDPGRKMVRRMLGVIAEYERELIVVRMRRGRALKAARGGYAGGAPRYGYRAHGKTLVADPAEQAVITRARQLHRAGRSLREIGEQLAAEGHRPKRGERWHPTTVARILTRGSRS